MRDVVRGLLILGAGYAVMTMMTATRVFPRPVPFVLMLCIISVGAAVWWRVDRPNDLARERTADGFCPRCGYDLTANVSGVCPECGAIRPDPPLPQ